MKKIRRPPRDPFKRPRQDDTIGPNPALQELRDLKELIDEIEDAVKRPLPPKEAVAKWRALATSEPSEELMTELAERAILNIEAKRGWNCTSKEDRLFDGVPYNDEQLTRLRQLAEGGTRKQKEDAITCLSFENARPEKAIEILEEMLKTKIELALKTEAAQQILYLLSTRMPLSAESTRTRIAVYQYDHILGRIYDAGNLIQAVDRGIRVEGLAQMLQKIYKLITQEIRRGTIKAEEGTRLRENIGRALERLESE